MASIQRWRGAVSARHRHDVRHSNVRGVQSRLYSECNVRRERGKESASAHGAQAGADAGGYCRATQSSRKPDPGPGQLYCHHHGLGCPDFPLCWCNALSQAADCRQCAWNMAACGAYTYACAARHTALDNRIHRRGARVCLCSCRRTRSYASRTRRKALSDAVPDCQPCESTSRSPEEARPHSLTSLSA